jgi:tRNA-2-methylthio-N6-dimethylallyladenosine synthase
MWITPGVSLEIPAGFRYHEDAQETLMERCAMKQADAPATPELNGCVRVQVRTYGCQMNVLDSEIISGLLRARGFTLTDRESEADAILFNTCSVRDLSERKVIGKLGMLHRGRARRPELVLGVLGCMAELAGARLLERQPYIDFVCGTNNRQHVPDLLLEALRHRVAGAAQTRYNAADLERLRGALQLDDGPPSPSWQPPVAVGLDARSTVDERIARRPQPWRAFVEIVRGCSNFCSYCVVPYARGPEVSRAPDDILAEITQLANAGCVEITLLGQNVNSYGKDLTGGSALFPELLRQINGIEGVRWIRFVTSNPHDISPAMIEAIADCERVCRQMHFPLQAGADRILARMRRRYTCADYHAKIAALRAAVPSMVFSSDFIVGFPGETDAEFAETCAALTQIGFASAFIFKYSPRPGTAAARDYADDVPQAVKEQRHQHLLALQNEQTHAVYRRQVGSVQTVLVDGPSKLNTAMLQGRTAQYFNVVFSGTDCRPGTFVNVRMTHATPLTLYGELEP